MVYGNIENAYGVGNDRSMAVVRFNLEPMTSRIPKRTKSVSQPAHDVNPAQVYHALESLGLFKSKAGRSISQADVQRFAFRSTATRPFLRIFTSLCTGSFGIVLDFLSSHLLGEVEVNQRRSAIARYAFRLGYDSIKRGSYTVCTKISKTKLP